MELKRKYKILIIVTFGCIISLSSCKKLMDIDPPANTIGTAAAFGSDDKANSVMAGIYSGMINKGQMIFSNGATTLFAGLSSDEIVCYGGSLNPYSYALLTNNIDANNDFLTGGGLWSPAYHVIYDANGAIEKLSSPIANKIADSAKTMFTGEAKFIRAFSYFYLTNFYGDVPLVLSTDFNNTATLGRSPQAAVYAQIVQDLKDAQSLLPVDYSAGKGERIRANKWAATALLARAYLYQQNWKDAETQASSIIDNNQFMLVPQLENVFNNKSKEIIWQLKQNPILLTGNATYDGMNFSTIIQWEALDPDSQGFLLDPSVYGSISSELLPKNYLSDQLYSAFEAGDKRKAAWVRSTPSPNIDPYNGVTYNYPFKYTLSFSTSPTGNPPQYYVMLRLAELYLIRAEARAQLGDLNGAVSDINVIRTRAGLPNTTAVAQNAVLAAIAHERQIELFAECGHRWFDLKRTGKATEVLGAIKIKQPWKPSQLLYPIPVTEIVRDPRLIQNPGY